MSVPWPPIAVALSRRLGLGSRVWEGVNGAPSGGGGGGGGNISFEEARLEWSASESRWRRRIGGRLRQQRGGQQEGVEEEEV